MIQVILIISPQWIKNLIIWVNQKKKKQIAKLRNDHNWR